MKIALPRSILASGNLRIWVGASFFAAILWLFVTSEHKYTYVIEVPIEVRNIREGKTLEREVPPIADVRFRATGRALLKAMLLKSISDFKLVLDLERISTEYDFYLNDYYSKYSQKVVIPPGFELEFIEVVQPDTIHIDLADYMVKPVAVVTHVEVSPAPGFIQVGSLDIDPGMIELKGPKDIIRNVEIVETESREFTNVEAPLQIAMGLNLDFPRVVEASPPTVTIHVNVQSIGERIISEVPVKVLNKPEGMRVFPNPSTVSLAVTGGVDFITNLEPPDIEVFVDFETQWKKTELYYKPTVVVPSDVLKWRDLSPKTVELVVARISE